MNSTSPRRVRLVLGQEPQAGRNLGVEEQLPGSAIITSTTSASTIAARIWPSLFWLELMLPLASTMPARPPGLRWCSMCCSQA
jgi:hypothetical protein